MRLLRRPARGLLCALLLGLACVLAGPAGAQPSAWTPLDGPHAAALRTAAVAADGTLLAATSTDVFRYDGAAWVRVAGAMNGSIHDISPAPGGRVWAGTSGALRSDDGGQTWTWFSIRTAPHSGTSPAVLHVATGPDGTVYAGGFRTTNGGASWFDMSVYAYGTAFVGTTVYAATHDGVHRSTTAGGAWTPSGLQGVGVSHLAVTGDRLVVATEAGLSYSDGGTVWTLAASLPLVSGLAVGGDGAVWAAVSGGTAGGGLYRSGDGAMWPSAPTAFAGRTVHDVAAAGATLLALVDGNPYRSTDGGATWTEVADGLGFPYAQAALAHDGLLAVAASGAGPFASQDGGATWAPWTAGLASPTVQEMLADPSAGHAYARTHNAAYRAALPAAGAPGPWTGIPLPDGRIPEGLATDGAGHLLAVTSTTGFQGAVYRSADGGATWAPAWEGPDTFRPLLAAGGGVAAVQALGFFDPPRLLVTTDGGATWTVRAHPLDPDFSVAPPLFVDGAGRIYLADDNVLHRSADAGATWTTLGPAGPAGRPVLTLEEAPGVLCLSTGAGVWCSTDDGATFAAAGAGISGSHVVALVHDGPQWAALTADHGVFTASATTATAPPPAADGVALTVVPNPVRDRATVTLALDRSEAVAVEVFDALGRRVAVLHDGVLPPGGAHRFTLEAAGLPGGVYVVRASGASFAVVRRVLRL